MSVSNKFDKSKNDVLVENNAQTIFDHLADLEKASNVYSRRWFWELLQNAKDSVPDHGNVSIRVSLADNRLVFSHTGQPFEVKDILHLIFHGSSKKYQEGKTGRFGTGFMTTHLLSRKVTITGALADNTFFQFLLDREADTVGDQERKLEESYERFWMSNVNTNFADGDYNTAFEYNLSESSLEICKEGIDQLAAILPLVMAFNGKLARIDVSNEGRSFSTIRGNSNTIVKDNIKIIQQEVIYDRDRNVVFLTQSDDGNVAVLTKDSGGVLDVVEADDQYPKLFFDFPLFGTEKFGCPVVINSRKFDLRAERDGIYLVEDNKESIKENKRIVASCLDSVPVLVAYLSSLGIGSIFHLFKMKPPIDYTWLNSKWLRGLYVGLIEPLHETECLQVGPRKVILRDLRITHSTGIELAKLHRLLITLVHGVTPPISQIREWQAVAAGFSALEDKQVADYDFIVDEEKICHAIASAKTLEELNRMIAGGPEDESVKIPDGISWLNLYFKLLSSEQIALFTGRYAIVPNQKGVFVKKEIRSPFRDEIGDDSIKAVVKSFGWDIVQDLIDIKLKISDNVFQAFNLEMALSYISQQADKVTDEKLQELEVRSALIGNLKWLIGKKLNTHIREAHVIVERGREGEDGNYSLRRLSFGSDRLLASFPIWERTYPTYRELVLKKFVLIDDYASVLTGDDFEYLHSIDCVFLQPLLIRTTLTKAEQRHLLPVSEQEASNESEEIPQGAHHASDIAHLNRNDDGILTKTATSTKSAKALLRFLVTEILPSDNLFNKSSSVQLGSTRIDISNCLWVARLRATQWVPVRSDDREKPESEKPTVSNITELLRGEQKIIEALKTRNGAIFFNQLGISVADILRNFLSNSEDKLNWDMAFSTLLTNQAISPSLAVEMLTDTRLQDTYRKQKEERERIENNQHIGRFFESVFRQIFESTEYKQKGIVLTRTGRGSDFQLDQNQVSPEQDILDENNQEVIYKVGPVLIELKATGKEYAEMTPRQVQEAATGKNDYVLAVLPLTGLNIDETYVKTHVKFVTGMSGTLQQRHREFQDYVQKKIATTVVKADVQISIVDGLVRYQVKADKWRRGAKGIPEFLEWLKSRPTK